MTDSETANSPQAWRISIGGLLDATRVALVGLVPTFEKANINWDADENYDDFDRIAEALYDSIVRESIKSAIGMEGSAPVQRYGFSSFDGTPHSRIVVGDERAVFVAFASREQPFDHAVVETSGTTGETARSTVRFAFGQFELERMDARGNPIDAVKEVQVRL